MKLFTLFSNEVFEIPRTHFLLVVVQIKGHVCSLLNSGDEACMCHFKENNFVIYFVLHRGSDNGPKMDLE